jgi:hypothetical protein
MKKYISLFCFALGLALAGHAQQSPNSTVTAASLKSAAQARMAYNSTTGGNEFTTSLVMRVNPALALTAAQQKSLNTAFYNFFNEKGSFSKLKWSDQASYTQQVNTLVQKLITQLGTFLSSDQVNKFVAMKPASPRTSDPLVSIFY